MDTITKTNRYCFIYNILSLEKWRQKIHFVPVSFPKTNLQCAWLQASAAVQMRSLLFWDVMQHRLIVSYRHFRTTCRYRPQGSSSPRRKVQGENSFFLNCLTLHSSDCLLLEDGTDRVSRNLSNYQPTLRDIPEDEDLICNSSFCSMF